MLALIEEQLRDHDSVQHILNNKRIVNGPKFNFSKINECEVRVALKNLNVKKKDGHDNLHPRILQLTSEALAPSLTRLFNACIEKNYWPVEWKKGEWVPVYKTIQKT
jgi:hypothetical protein